MRCDIEEHQENNSANNLGRDDPHSGANLAEPLHPFSLLDCPAPETNGHLLLIRTV
jgi:hypothetical protein